MRARGLQPREKADIKRILRDKLDQPHLKELAKNPMQLSILLSLIHTRGSSLPDKRTALYDSYVDLFFSREAEKNTIVRDHRELLIAIHHYLAWVLHSEAEQGSNDDTSRGSIAEPRLHRLLAEYLGNEGYDPALSSIIFTGMVERVVALVSRVQGTYEFEVQPLREYFAARYLYETAPYSPAGNERRGTLPDRFNAISRDFYWLNVARFYAGCYSKGELASLIECLRDLASEDGYKLVSHPRILAATLLSDWVFTQHPKSVQEVVALILDGIGLRYVLASNRRRVASGSPLVLPKGCGNTELLGRCFDVLESDPPRDYALDLLDLIGANAAPEEAVQHWRSKMQNQNGASKARWIEFGLHLGALSRLGLDELEAILQDLDASSVLRSLFRARRFDYFERNSESYALAIQAVLNREASGSRHPRSQNVLEVLDRSLSADRYAAAFSSPHPIPLSEILKSGVYIGDTRVMISDLSAEGMPAAPDFPEVAKCRETILAAEVSIVARSCTNDVWPICTGRTGALAAKR